MSAIITLIQKDAAHLLTDGAAYSPDGALQFVCQKVRLIPHLACAVAMRGPWNACPPIFEAISFAGRTFDELRENMVPLLQFCSEKYAPHFEVCDAGPDFEVHVVGISETDGPTGYIVSSHDRGIDPWSLITLDGFSFGPNNPQISARVFGRIAPGRYIDDLDAAADGLATLEIMREIPAATIAGDDQAMVGGFAQLTSIGSDGITSRILKRWPDKIGERISMPFKQASAGGFM